MLQSLIRYQNEEPEAEWGGFTELLKELYEQRNQELMLRSQLRHFRQKDTFANYLNKFQELTNRMVKLSDNDKFVAFLDGLSDVYKHEVLKVPTCNTVREAIQICSNYEFCINSASSKRENVLMVSKALYGNEQKTPVRRNFNKSYDRKSQISNQKYSLWRKPSYSTSMPSSRQGSDHHLKKRIYPKSIVSNVKNQVIILIPVKRWSKK